MIALNLILWLIKRLVEYITRRSITQTRKNKIKVRDESIEQLNKDPVSWFNNHFDGMQQANPSKEAATASNKTSNTDEKDSE